MGNLHRVQSAVQTSEDFASEAPRLLLLQSAAGHCLPDRNTATVPGVTESPLAWSETLRFIPFPHASQRDAAYCSSKTSLPGLCAIRPPHSKMAPRLQLLRSSEDSVEGRASVTPRAGISAATFPLLCSAHGSSLRSCFCKYPSNSW